MKSNRSMQHGKKIIVTGGAGYIGSHTVVALVEAGYYPIIVDNFTHQDRAPYEGLKELIGHAFILYEGDCRDQALLNQIARIEGPIEGLIHFAASKSVPESFEKTYDYYDNNLNALIRVLGFASDQSISVFIFSSSASVYGLPSEVPILEEAPMGDPLSPYAHTKQIGERILYHMQQCEHIACGISLRYFNPIGAHASGLIGETHHRYMTNLLPCLMEAVIQRRPLPIYGNEHATPDGTCIRDYIHVMDLAEAHVHVLDAALSGKLKGYEVLNIGTGKGASVQEIIDRFSQENKVKILCEVASPRKGDPPVLYADVKKIRQCIGWRSRYNFTQALRDAWAWHRKKSVV